MRNTERPYRFAAHRLPFLLPGGLALIFGLWTGIARMGWPPWIQGPEEMMGHGPLMVSGFLGTLISLERAVALEKKIAYLAPLFCGAGVLLLVSRLSVPAGTLSVFLGSVGLFLASLWLALRQKELFTLIMLLGALAWVGANLFWVLGWPVHNIVLLYFAFLLLTISGERLELSRMLAHPPGARFLFLICLLLLFTGLSASSFPELPGANSVGDRLVGMGAFLLGLWLVRYDIARRTVKKEGLVRYIAICLLSGYFWLIVSGVYLFIYTLPAGGLVYDAILHAFFVGFVFAMIFGHAPIIFPAVLRIQVRYTPWFYLPLGLLHLSLLARIAGDMVSLNEMRGMGSVGNLLSIILFFVLFILNAIRARVTATN